MSSKLKIVAVAAVVLVAAVGAGLWWFLRDDAPAEVDLQSAIESVEDTPATSERADEGSGSSGSTADAPEGIDGAWSVDTSSGEFDFDSATGTFAGFRIQEELASIGSTTAVGRTGDVSGSITIDGTTLTAATFEVGVGTITTNDSRRDDQVHRALEVGEFPTASFTLAEPVDLGAGAAAGEPVTVTAVGDLTIHGVTRRVEVPIDAQLVNGTVVAVGSIDIVFADYGVAVPESQIVLSVEDHGVMEFQILFTR